MGRLGYVVSLVCGLQCIACGSGLEDDASNGGVVVLDQAVPAGDVDPVGPPAAPRQESESIATPGTQSLRVRLANMAGSGCARNTHLVRSGTTAASSIEVLFEEDDFAITLPPGSSETEASLNCLLEVRVSGIAGHQAVSTHIGYSGNRNLPFDAFAYITSRVMWRDAEFTTHSATKTEEFFDTVGSWIMEHSMRATDNGARSRCFASDEDEDVFYIDISMRVRNASPRPAMMNLTWTTLTSNTRAGAAQSQPPVAVRIEGAPCTP